MNIIIKPMILSVKKINDTKYMRSITDMEGNEIWNGGEQYYIFDNTIVMNKTAMNNLINQMKKLPHWNIVKVISDFGD